MISDAIKLAQAAINRLGTAAELPEFIQLTNQEQVREYAIEIITTVSLHRQEIESHIEAALVAWQLNRLPKIDRDILRIAVAEMLFLDLPVKIAINEAVELAKRYSDDDGFRFINGVLRKVSDRLQKENLIKH
ncbi:MAG: transcription antitermination factor NusB [Xenococcaceae cyanobacterium MO_207.B15]|nr:transcription antitermination factor NusB [Xenococcaceae cyanobacterium MO_207.B15]